MLFSALAPLLSLLASPTAAPVVHDDRDFDRHWYDGQAEVAGYRWSGTRYGELRAGEAITIFVTEPFSKDLYVKLDTPAGRPADRVTALKLNLVRDFQTGIYDYNTMVSCFVDVSDFSLIKQTFSSAEWCGHVFEEIRASAKQLDLAVQSYFQDESEQRELPRKEGGLVGEELLIHLRGLRGAFLAPGASKTVPYLPDPFERRLRHQQAQWTTLKITREREAREIEVPAGRFEAIEYVLTSGDGRTGRVALQTDAPHRVLSWSWERRGVVLDRAELTGSKRMPYWELHGEGQEALRNSIGLND